MSNKQTFEANSCLI